MKNNRRSKKVNNKNKMSSNKRHNSSSKSTKSISKRKKGYDEVLGVYEAVNKNFGFVRTFIDYNNDDKKIYIKKDNSLNALDGDRVVVEILPTKTGDSLEGNIIKIVERDKDYVVGIFEDKGNFGFVEPINKKIGFDIHIERKYFKDAVTDSIVSVKLLSGNNNKNNPEGIIMEVLGNKNDPNIQILSIIKDFGIVEKFNEETLKEAEEVAEEIKESDLKGRKDLRNLTTITIDGLDAKDLDDAISLEVLDNGNYKLYVSIADVSHYVKEGSFIDKEALKRGNSVYLIDRVIPMIPHILSNGMCSLNGNVDRLAMTCEIEYDRNLDVVDHAIYKSIINSNMRMSYVGVDAILNDKELTNGENIDDYKPYKEYLNKMMNLSRRLRKKREERGAVEFNFKEVKVLVDENLKPIDVVKVDRLEAHELIEDFMLAANETVAREYAEREIPFVYRTHEDCDKDKIINLMKVLKNLQIGVPYKEKYEPMDIQKLIKKVEGKPEQFAVEKMALRSMKQARYTKEPIGHFALASKYYTHFTSPIRRYSDLQIHRIITEDLENKLNDSRKDHYDLILDEVSMHISECERKAVDCEREVDALKECEFMKEKIGERFVGKISGLTNFGIFVELESGIEGMVPLKEMTDDYYEYDEERMIIFGQRSNKTFNIGDELKVELIRVDVDMRIIDFRILWE